MGVSRDGRLVGRVVGLWRYPVKSMGAEALRAVDVSWHGLAGDRRWAFIRNDAPRSGFPWFTLREREDMSRYRPALAEPDRPEQSGTLVTSPSGFVRDVIDPALGAELSAGGLRAVKQDRGVFDTFPLSLITTQTIARLGEMVDASLDVQRFRPNFLVEATEATPFVEDSWVGRVVTIGGLRMRVDKRDGRCVVISIDPLTGVRDPKVLRAVAQQRNGQLGVYGTTVEPGRVAMNDAVSIEPGL